MDENGGQGWQHGAVVSDGSDPASVIAAAVSHSTEAPMKKNRPSGTEGVTDPQRYSESLQYLAAVIQNLAPLLGAGGAIALLTLKLTREGVSLVDLRSEDPDLGNTRRDDRPAQRENRLVTAEKSTRDPAPGVTLESLKAQGWTQHTREELDESLRETYAKLLRASGLTQGELAKRVGMDAGQLSRVLKSPAKSRPATLERIRTALGRAILDKKS